MVALASVSVYRPESESIELEVSAVSEDVFSSFSTADEEVALSVWLYGKALSVLVAGSTKPFVLVDIALSVGLDKAVLAVLVV